MAYTGRDLIDIGTNMWREGAKVNKTKIEGIFECITKGHGGYLVDINVHPELEKYGTETNNSSLRAFEEDYEAMKVIWLYPSLVNNKEWYDNLKIDEVVHYETDSKFKREFPYKGGIEINRNKNDMEEMKNITDVIKSFCVQLIHQYDLNIKIVKDENEKNIFKIEDLQNHNYANIEDGEFHNLTDVIEGTDIYHDNYIFDSLEERKKAKEIIKNDDWDLIASRFLKSDKVHDVLEQVYPHNFNKLITEDVSKELKKILDKEEFPLLYYYIEKSEKLFDIVNYDMLKEYEESLNLYFKTDDIIREDDEIYSKSNQEFNRNIIKLADDVIGFNDFLENENIKKSEKTEAEEI